jgi:N-carbamoyl-L-amino-acid hydrolase
MVRGDGNNAGQLHLLQGRESRASVKTPTRLPIDTARLDHELEALALISDSPAPVVTRVLFSEADLRGRQVVKQLFSEAGLRLREDAVGNIFARWPGSDDHVPAVATGSHIDAIPNAGKFDGVVGVLGALEAVRALQAAGFQPKRAIELVVFTAEEPTRFGLGCLGSRLLSGVLAPEKAARLRDRDGQTLDDWRRLGGCHGPLDSVRLPPGCYAAFVELHIEQGPILEWENLDIGIVEKIAAPSTLRVQLTGVGGHAGAVLMPERRDALLAGAEIALAVERAALTSGSPDTVATTGVLRLEPGAVNSVPCRAWLEIDLRGTVTSARDTALEQIEAAAAEICERRGIELQMERVNVDPPAVCDASLVDTVAGICARLGLSHRRMISRAYHDSLFVAQLCPTTMIFIPSRGGVSHRPDEYSSLEQIERGVRVLAETLALAAGSESV